MKRYNIDVKHWFILLLDYNILLDILSIFCASFNPGTLESAYIDYVPFLFKLLAYHIHLFLNVCRKLTKLYFLERSFLFDP